MFKIYTIKEGETIESIASKFSTTKEMLMEINGFDEDLRFAKEDMMIVPNNNIIFQRYKIKKGDTIYELAKKNNVDVDTLLQINGLDDGDYIYPDEFLLIPNENMLIYITKKDDTLMGITNKFHNNIDSVLDMNQSILLEPNQLIVFQKNI